MKRNRLMMMPGLVLLLVMNSCDGKKDEENMQDVEALVNQAATGIDADVSGENKCLLSFAGKLNELVTPQMAATATGLPAGNMHESYSKVLKNTAYHEMIYSWENGRMQEMPYLTGKKINTQVSDKVAISGIKAMSVTQFKNTYRNVTQDEMAIAEKKTNDALQGKTGNEQVKKAVKKLDEIGADRNQAAAAAGELRGMFAEVTESYSDVSGLGDAASWNSFENRIYVLKGGVVFSINADLGDTRRNKEIAVKLAREVLRKCD